MAALTGALATGSSIFNVWVVLALAEAAAMAFCLARVLFGPISLTPHPPLWLLWAVVAALGHLLLSHRAMRPLLTEKAVNGDRFTWMLACTLPTLGLSLLLLVAQQLRPDDLERLLWGLSSPIEPLPSVTVSMGFLLLFLLRLLAVSTRLPGERRWAVVGSSASFVIPVALLIIGVLQASVYLVPVGNAFFRAWAVADAVHMGAGYPVTITEPATLLAGGPPYIRDLPLFPLALLAAFSLIGHNTAAAHLPAALFNALFPISLYLLIRAATGSRTIALLFAVLAALFPYLRFWVLNLPDPDPVMLMALALAGYLYLRALQCRGRPWVWLAAGVAGGALTLVRPEGVLYTGFLALGLLAHRPRPREITPFLMAIGVFLIPMVAVWWVNFGILWPQNFNSTLGLAHPQGNLELLKARDALGFYQRGLGLDGLLATLLLVGFLASVALGTCLMALLDRRLLALAVPGIGNTVAIFFTSPGVTNAYHFADFFRHLSFGVPFLVLTSAYAFNQLYLYLRDRARWRALGYLCVLLLVAAAIREGDILANPTATHRPGATQVLTTYTYLSLESILRNPMPLPILSYQWNGEIMVAYSASMHWPEAALEHFEPLDMSFDSHGRPFGYASVVAFLMALFVSLLLERRPTMGRGAPTEGGRFGEERRA